MRLFLGITAVSAVVLAGLGFAIEESVKHSLRAEFDRTLLEKARALASLVEQTGDVPHFDFQQTQYPEYDPGPGSACFEVFLDGAPWRKSASLGDHELPPGARDGEAHGITLPDGRHGRILVLPFTPIIDDEGQPPPFHRTTHTGIVTVARPSADLDRQVSQLVALTVGLCGIATLLSGAALIAVAASATRPLGKLARQIEGVRETDLSTALSAHEFPLELVPVVERLNGLLHRLGQVFARERGFTADVAHELRTPLAGLLATLEVARSRPRDSAGYEEAIDKSLVILRQMQTLVENLLLLARADSGQLKLRRETIDLEALLLECELTFEQPAAARQLSINIHGEARVNADREFLRIIFNNLLDNAVSYAVPGSAIDVRISGDESRAAVEISNEGHALAAPELEQLFERFKRKDTARAATGLHAGLGLSISRRLAELQDARITLRLEQQRFVARLELAMPPSRLRE
jgi:two-component system sensor histidine kinase QseC